MKKLIFILILLNTFGVFAEKPKLAVMNFTDETEGRLSKDLVKNGSKLIRSRFTRNAKEFFEVVTDKENEAALAAMKKESHRLDRDRAFQIELGKQVSAAKIVMSTIGNLDKKTFLITSTLTDVARGVDENSADAIFDGTSDGLSKAVDKIIIQLLGFEDESLVPKKPKKSEGQIACEEARAAGSEQKWKGFLRYYADEYPDCVPEARKQLEEIAFLKAEREDTVEAWQEYLDEYPNANRRHAITAEEGIAKLKKAKSKMRYSNSDSWQNSVEIQSFKVMDNEPVEVENTLWSPVSEKRLTFKEADVYCSSLKSGGYSDWHLPAVDDLRTLVQRCPNLEPDGACRLSEEGGCLLARKCLNKNTCKCSSSGKYSKLNDAVTLWSASVNSSDSKEAYFIDFGSGKIGVQYIGAKAFVRCTR